MPFTLSNLIDLLEALEALYTAVPPLSSSALSQKTSSHITSWFEFHLPTIRNNPQTLVSIFSFLLPGLRVDRTYALREPSLSKIIGKCLFLGATRQNTLNNWRSSKEGDFGSVVQRVMAQAENPSNKAVTVEYVEGVLNKLASRSPFSNDTLRGNIAATGIVSNMEIGAQHVLGSLYRKLTSKEGKWVTRAILKCHLPVFMPENHTLSTYHFLLPYLLYVQHDLEKACNLICSPEYCSTPHSPSNKQISLELMCTKILKPEIGVKVGRPEFIKARSCKHVAGIAAGRRMSMERKYDGEYCQIHIDLSKNDEQWLRIFSKSGRDSTDDRVRVHDTLKEALNINKPKQMNWKKCIIEGELVVYNDREKRIMEFHHLRSHVNRAGTYIGNAKDGSRDRSSHLMIFLFDCLLYNDQSLLHRPYSERIEFLKKILPHPIVGRCEFAERVEIDFAKGKQAVEMMRALFAAGIVRRWEGFVLKLIDEPYLDLLGRQSDGNIKSYGWIGGKSAWIKLKKDYIQGCGDTGDFAIIGGTTDRRRGWERKLHCGALTTFHVGCLLNKEDVQKVRVKPRFKVIFDVTYNISKPDLEWINKLAHFETLSYKTGQLIDQFDLNVVTGTGMAPIDCIFTNPFVFEIMGGGFEKPTNCSFYIPRHPRVCKIHWDRSYMEAMSFMELQKTAGAALKATDDDCEDMRAESQWIKKLLEKDLSVRELKKREAVSVTPEAAIKGEIFKASSKPTEWGRKVAALPLVPVEDHALHDITQPPSTPGRPCLQGSMSIYDSSPVTRTTTSLFKRANTVASCPELDHHRNYPSKKFCLANPTPAQAPEQQLLQENSAYQKRSQKHEKLPLQVTTFIPVKDAQQPRNGHSSICPLRGATVFLPHYLMKFPKLIEKITNHDVEIIHLLPTAKEIPSLMTASRKGVVLVEANRTSLTKRTLRCLYDILKFINGGVEGDGYRWEVYDWRIVNRHQPEGKWEVDWSLFYVWSV